MAPFSWVFVTILRHHCTYSQNKLNSTISIWTIHSTETEKQPATYTRQQDLITHIAHVKPAPASVSRRHIQHRHHHQHQYQHQSTSKNKTKTKISHIPRPIPEKISKLQLQNLTHAQNHTGQRDKGLITQRASDYILALKQSTKATVSQYMRSYSTVHELQYKRSSQPSSNDLGNFSSSVQGIPNRSKAFIWV